MKNKLISLTIVFAFMACILCTPAHMFFQSFYKSYLSFKSVNIEGFSKNILLSADKIAQFDDFTQNIKAPKSKVFDFSDNLAIFSKAEKQKFIAEKSPHDAGFGQVFDFSNSFYFTDTDRHRLRTPANADIGTLFIFFILIYIGMLRAVYSHKNISLLNIEKPLFAV